jgi:nitrous oxide reductase accessory protein NosL
MRRRDFIALPAALAACVCAGRAAAGPATWPKPGQRDLCPVCGMLVSKYPHWIATILYKDGHAPHHFDGAKDMFKFWFEPEKYVKGRRQSLIAAIGVTDYYDLRRIDARSALYIIGSDVLGPMGHEFVPTANQADAEEFLKEHKGKRILRFDQITKDMPVQLDNGKF